MRPGSGLQGAPCTCRLLPLLRRVTSLGAGAQGSALGLGGEGRARADGDADRAGRVLEEMVAGPVAAHFAIGAAGVADAEIELERELAGRTVQEDRAAESAAHERVAFERFLRVLQLVAGLPGGNDAGNDRLGRPVRGDGRAGQLLDRIRDRGHHRSTRRGAAEIPLDANARAGQDRAVVRVAPGEEAVRVAARQPLQAHEVHDDAHLAASIAALEQSIGKHRRTSADWGEDRSRLGADEAGQAALRLAKAKAHLLHLFAGAREEDEQRNRRGKNPTEDQNVTSVRLSGGRAMKYVPTAAPAATTPTAIQKRGPLDQRGRGLEDLALHEKIAKERRALDDSASAPSEAVRSARAATTPSTTARREDESSCRPRR